LHVLIYRAIPAAWNIVGIQSIRNVYVLTSLLFYWHVYLPLQQIAELQKENFSLKLRIYFLEERTKKEFDGSGEDIYKIVRFFQTLFCNIHVYVATENPSRPSGTNMLHTTMTV